MPRIVPLLSLSLAALLATAAPAAAQGVSSATPATPGKASSLHFEVDGLAPGLDGRLPTALELTAPGFKANRKALAKRCGEQAAKLNECPGRAGWARASCWSRSRRPTASATSTSRSTSTSTPSRGSSPWPSCSAGAVVPGTLSADGGITIGFDPLPAGPPFEGVTYRLKQIAFDFGAKRTIKQRKVRRVNGERRVASCASGWT